MGRFHMNPTGYLLDRIRYLQRLNTSDAQGGRTVTYVELATFPGRVLRTSGHTFSEDEGRMVSYSFASAWLDLRYAAGDLVTVTRTWKNDYVNDLTNGNGKALRLGDAFRPLLGSGTWKHVKIELHTLIAHTDFWTFLLFKDLNMNDVVPPGVPRWTSGVQDGRLSSVTIGAGGVGTTFPSVNLDQSDVVGAAGDKLQFIFQASSTAPVNNQATTKLTFTLDPASIVPKAGDHLIESESGQEYEIQDVALLGSLWHVQLKVL